MALSAALMAGGTLLGGILSSRAASRAADAQERQNTAAIGETRRQFDQTRADMAPFLGAGQRANAALAFELGLGPRPQERAPDLPGIRRLPGARAPAQPMQPSNSLPMWGGDGGGFAPQAAGPRFAVGDATFDTRREARDYRDGMAGDVAPEDSFDYGGFRATPGYEFRFGEGLDAMQSTLAAGGMLGSGRALRAATRYGQNVGAEEYGNYLARLMTLSGRGQGQVNSLASFGANAAGNIGNAMMATGQAQGAAAVNQGNITTGTLEGLAGIGGRFAGGGFGGGFGNGLSAFTPSPYGASVAPTSSFLGG